MMKQRFSMRGVLVVCVASVAVLAGAGRGVAQEGQGVFITQASARLTKLVDTGNKKGYQLHNNSFSIGGGWLKQSAEKWVVLYSIQLTADKEYVFLAAGDNDAKDVDLRIQDSNKNEVAKDDKVNPEAVVVFRPKTSGVYTISVRLFDSRENYDCVVLSVVMVKK